MWDGGMFLSALLFLVHSLLCAWQGNHSGGGGGDKDKPLDLLLASKGFFCEDQVSVSR